MTIKGMVRAGDYDTSVEAAEKLEPRLNELQRIVFDIEWEAGPMNDYDLEHWPTIAHWPPSTARKRRTELKDKGLLAAMGKDKNPEGSSMTVWGVVGLHCDEKGE